MTHPGARSSSHRPPPRRAGPLPSWGTAFVGRTDEIARLGTLLARPEVRLITLFGPGGIGKTRLAAEFLRLHPAGPRSLFISLEAAEELDAGLVEGLGIGVEHPERRLERTAAAIGDEPTVLVLDNFEHLAPQAELLESLLEACPSLTLIVTSRALLALRAEWVLPVAGLSHLDRRGAAGHDGAPEALSLFCQRFEQASGRAVSVDEMSVARGICLRLHGVPLALELAASWGATLTLAEIAEDLEQRRGVLATRHRGFPERQRSIRAVFEHSWRLLTAEEQRAFARLSVFRDGFTRDAAAAVGDVSVETLAALSEKSLLQRDDTGRYRLHTLALEFAAEQLAAGPAAAESLADRHSAFYLGHLQSALPDIDGHRQVEAVRDLLQEWANIRAAWERALARRHLEHAARSLYLLDMVCSFRARYDEALEFAAAALAVDASDAEDGGLLRFTALVARSWVLVRLGQLDEAEALAREAQATLAADSLPPAGLHLDPLLALGTVALARGNYAEAEQLASAGVERARAVAHRGRESLALYVLENALWEQVRYPEAATALAQAFDISESLGDSWFLAFLHNDLARQASREGRFERAEHHLARSIELRSAFNDAGGIAIAEEQLARLELDRDHPGAGQRLLRAASLYRQVGDRGGVASVHAALGRLALRQGDLETARSRFAQALQAAVDMGYGHLISEVLLEAALWSHTRGDRGALPVLAFLAGDSTTPAAALARIDGLVASLRPEAWNAARRAATGLSREKAAEAVLASLRATRPGMAAAPETAVEALSPREMDVLRMVASGATNAAIAASLGLKLGTAKWYTSQVFAKLGARNRTEAVARARQRDLIP